MTSLSMQKCQLEATDSYSVGTFDVVWQLHASLVCQSLVMEEMFLYVM